MKSFHYLLILCCCLSFVACQNDGTAEGEIPSPAGKSPETVLREWMSYYDNNQYQKAKALSTSRAITFLEAMEELTASAPADSTIIHTEFLELKCQEYTDYAICAALIKDEELGEVYRDSFLLARERSYWLIDIPESALLEDESLMDDLFQELN
ncbi:MAG: hypothetical protein AAGH79_00775 [Bacteroidota bacterium]